MKPAALKISGRWGTLLLIASLHVGGLTTVMLHLDKPVVVTTPPTMIGMLVAPPSEQPPQPARPAPPKPQPAQNQIQKPRATPPSLPPIPNAPPSERAITAPPPADPSPPRNEPSVAQTTPAPAPTAASPATEATPAPVTPPYASAAHLNNPAPVYPAVSRRLGEQGRVILDVSIQPDGTVGEIRLKRSCGHGRLDDAALDAVKRWRFVPARRGNEAIAYRYDLPISFSLTN